MGVNSSRNSGRVDLNVKTLSSGVQKFRSNGPELIHTEDTCPKTSMNSGRFDLNIYI